MPGVKGAALVLDLGGGAGHTMSPPCQGWRGQWGPPTLSLFLKQLCVATSAILSQCVLRGQVALPWALPWALPVPRGFLQQPALLQQRPWLRALSLSERGFLSSPCPCLLCVSVPARWELGRGGR